MTPSGGGNHRVATAVIVALWAGAVMSFLFTASQGSSAFHLGQVVSGVLVIVAGTLVAVDWLGVATAMGRRSARRWSGRLQAPAASDPATATRASRMLAWWWIAFGVLIVVLAVSAPR